MEDLDHLYRLQLIDLEIRGKEDQLRRLQVDPPSVKEASDLSLAVHAREQEKWHLETEMRDRELEAESITSKIKRLNQELLAGRGGHKELAEKQTDLASQKTRRAAIEDRVLEMMELLEGLAAALAAEHRALAEKEAQRDLEMGGRTREKNDLENGLVSLRTRHEELAREIPPALGKLYEQLRRNMLGRAMGDASDGRCGGCGVEIATNLRKQLRRRESMMRCENCGRILYLPPEEPKS